MLKLLDFHALWCGPCKAMKPIIEEIREDYPNVEVEFIDADVNVELTGKYGIMSVPTFILLKDDEVVFTHMGKISKSELEAIINKFR